MLAQIPVQSVDGVATIKGLEGIFNNIVIVVISLAGMTLFIMLVAGGFKYITSAGNPETVAGAKKTLTYAVLGVVFIGASLLILWILSLITGYNLFFFRVSINLT